jgi:hypothetical protein
MLNQTSILKNDNTTSNILNTKNILKLTKPKKLNKSSFDLGRSLRRFGKQSMPTSLKSGSLTKRINKTMGNPTVKTFESNILENAALSALKNISIINQKKPSVKIIRPQELVKRTTYIKKDNTQDIPAVVNKW